MPLHHYFSSVVPDNLAAQAAGKVIPSEWNHEHILVDIPANAVLFNVGGSVSGSDQLTFDPTTGLALTADAHITGNVVVAGDLAANNILAGIATLATRVVLAGAAGNALTVQYGGIEQKDGADYSPFYLAGQQLDFYTGLAAEHLALRLFQSGNATFGGNVSVAGSIAIGGTANFTGDITFNGALTFNGTADFVGDVTFTGDATFDGGITFNGAADFVGDVTFTGDATFNGGITFVGDAVFSGGVTFADATFDSITVNGDIAVNEGTIRLSWGVPGNELQLAYGGIAAMDGALSSQLHISGEVLHFWVGTAGTTEGLQLQADGDAVFSNAAGWGLFIDCASSATRYALQSATASLRFLNAARTAWISTSALNVGVDTTGMLRWGSFGGEGPFDVALARNAAGVMEIDNGTAGQFRDLKARTITVLPVTGASFIQLNSIGTMVIDADVAVGSIPLLIKYNGQTAYSFAYDGGLIMGSAAIANPGISWQGLTGRCIWIKKSIIDFNQDTGIASPSVGVVEINSGVVGTYRDLKLRNLIYALPAADGTATGPTTSDYNCGYTSSVVGELVYLDGSFTWQKADANTAYDGLLAIVLEVKATGQAMKVALPGSTIWVSAQFPALTNAPVYMSETAGELTLTPPPTADSATRCVGWGVHGDKLYFYPSPDYGIHV